jgi:hypothetical protein
VAKSLRGFGFRQPIVVDLRLLRVRLSRECPDDLAGKHCEYGVPLGDVRVGEDRIRASESKLPLETPFPGKEVSACPNHRPKQPRFISPRLISICGGRGSRVYASERFSRDGSPPVLPSFFLLPSSFFILHSSFYSYLLSFYTESIYAETRLPLRSGENGHAVLGGRSRHSAGRLSAHPLCCSWKFHWKTTLTDLGSPIWKAGWLFSAWKRCC